MITLGFVLFLLGLLISTVAVGLSLSAFARLAKDFFNPESRTDLFAGFGTMFKRHLGAMAVSAVGGFMASVGIVIVILGLVQGGMPS